MQGGLQRAGFAALLSKGESETNAFTDGRFSGFRCPQQFQFQECIFDQAVALTLPPRGHERLDEVDFDGGFGLEFLEVLVVQASEHGSGLVGQGRREQEKLAAEGRVFRGWRRGRGSVRAILPEGLAALLAV